MTIKLLALDYGQKRVGVAVSQSEAVPPSEALSPGEALSSDEVLPSNEAVLSGEAPSSNGACLLDNLASGGLAFPRPAILRTTRQEFFQRLLALIEAEAPAAIVLGLPLHADGSDSLTTRQVRNFAASLARRSPLPIYFMDEALSSDEAASLLRAAGAKPRREEGIVDSQAAVGILQSFLNLAPRQRHGRKYLGEAAS